MVDGQFAHIKGTDPTLQGPGIPSSSYQRIFGLSNSLGEGHPPVSLNFS